MAETLFVASDSMVDVAKSVGIPTGAGHNVMVDACPFVVGDFISYPAAPTIAARVVWRLYSHASDSKPARWIIGIEKARHPLEDPT
jgi:hypothetical protein